MDFLVDECAGPGVARWLRTQGHDVVSIYEVAPGMEDAAVIARAYREGRILITNDKDFGEKVYRERRPHRGVVLLRLSDERAPSKIAVLRKLLMHFGDQLPDAFVVVTETQVRFARK